MSVATGISSLDHHDGVAVLTIDSPPVNALSHAVRIAISDGVAAAMADPATKAFILICGGRTFFAGADISELGRPILPPLLQDVIGVLESADIPTIAAIHGTALGGGFELALACHYRIIDRRARVGLPEAALGLLPGAGGTQRTPRLIGVAAAIDMIALGKSYDAGEARAIGLVDAVAENDLRGAAIRYAQTLVKDGAPLRRVRDRATDIGPAEAEALSAAFRAGHPELFRHLKAPEAILKAIEAAATLPFDEGILREKELSRDLVTSPESAAQRHIFFAERAAAKIPDQPKDAKPAPIESVALLTDEIAIDLPAAEPASADIVIASASASVLSTIGIDGPRLVGAKSSGPVVEIMRAPDAGPVADVALADHVRRRGRLPVVMRAGPAAISTACLAAARDAATTLIDAGTAPASIEAALVGAGFPESWILLPDGRADATTGESPEAIVNLIADAVADAGQRLLDTGTAYRPGDIDIVMVKGLGWPLHLGGPMFARQRG
jgi:3-hydroxyacyl-CoA dehydrogenase